MSITIKSQVYFCKDGHCLRLQLIDRLDYLLGRRIESLCDSYDIPFDRYIFDFSADPAIAYSGISWLTLFCQNAHLLGSSVELRNCSQDLIKQVGMDVTCQLQDTNQRYSFLVDAKASSNEIRLRTVT